MRPLVAVAAAIVCVACTSPGTGTSGTGTATTNTASTFTPVTGIAVDAHELFLRQGCGTRPGEVYKYAVVVFQTRNAVPCPSGPPQAVVAGVYDCFADAVFANLGSGSGTAVGLSQSFDLAIAAFDEPTYAAQAGLVAGEVQAIETNHCPSGPVDDRVAALDAVANWTTTCTVDQQPSVQSLAACAPPQESAADAGAGDAGAGD